MRCAAEAGRNHAAVLHAFDLIEHNDADLRDLPLIERKRRLAKLIGKAQHAIRFVEHLAHEGATVFEHACRMGLDQSSTRWDRGHGCAPVRPALMRMLQRLRDP